MKFDDQVIGHYNTVLFFHCFNAINPVTFIILANLKILFFGS